MHYRNIFVLIFVFVAHLVFAQIDANIVKTVFDLNGSDWQTLQNAENPSEMPGKLLFKISDRLRQRHVDGLFRDNHDLVADVPNYSEIQNIPQQKFVDITQNLVVTKVEKIKATADSDLYLCDVSIGEKHKFFCFSTQVPQEWPVGEPMRAKAGIFAINIRSGIEPVFVASKIEWFPENLLGKYGMDYGTMDAVAALPIAEILTKGDDPGKHNMQSLRFGESDIEPFYQMLRAASSIPKSEIDSELKKSGEKNFSVVELFNRPNLQQGRLFRLKGIARRIDKVTVEDEYIRTHFGINYYYQIALFTEDSQGNPLIFCIRDLPSGLSSGDNADFNVSLSISGFFYKTWAYKKAKTTEDNPSQYQFAPLLVAGYIDWFKVHERDNRETSSPIGVWTSTAVFLGLACVWIIFRRFIRRNNPVRFEFPSEKIHINEFPNEHDEKQDYT